MELIIVSGNVGTSALKDIPGGSKVLNFSVASHDGVGENRETTWYQASLFGDRAEKLAGSIVPGLSLLVHGKPSVDAYMSNDGKPKASVNIRVDRIEFLSGKKKEGSEEQPE